MTDDELHYFDLRNEHRCLNRFCRTHGYPVANYRQAAYARYVKEHEPESSYAEPPNEKNLHQT